MGRRLCCVVALAVIAGFLGAQNAEDFALKVEPVEAGSTSVLVIGSWTVDGVQGWSWGLCHNGQEAKIGDCAGQQQPPNPCEGGCANIECPQDMATAGLGGGAVSFHSLNILEEGITQGVVIDFTMQHDLDANDSFEFLKITYELQGGATCTELRFCSLELGVPPVENVFVVNGASYAPATQEGAQIGECVQPPCQDLELSLDFGAAQVSGDPGSQVAAVPVLLTTAEDQVVDGFQFGVALDSADLVVDGVDQGQAVTDIGGADFFGVQVLEGGATVGAVIDLEPSGDPPQFRALPACTAGQEIAVVQVKCSATASGEVAGTVSFTDQLGDPQIDIVVDVDGTSLSPKVGAAADVTLQCAPVVVEKFVRGDANQDGTWNVSDGVAIAKAVFGMGSKLPLIEKCMDSADANDDGKVDTADAVYLLEYLFVGGPALPEPLACGEDPTGDTLDCPEYPPCQG